MTRFTLVVSFAFVACCTAVAQDSVTLDQLIKPAEQKKLGLNKLTATEREKLRVLLVEKMADAYQNGHAKAVQENPGIQKADAPGAVIPRDGRYSGAGGGHWVKENIDRGSMLLLEDGSLWQVDRLERLDASLWLRTSSITVVEAKDGMAGFDYLLINTDDREKVHAKYRGKN